MVGLLIDQPTPTLLEPEKATVFTLSYLGDAYYELMARHWVLQRFRDTKTSHSTVTLLVRCQTQATIMNLLEDHLNAEERELIRRARNQKNLQVPKHATKKEYRDSTALECLIGWHWLQQNQSRLQALFALPAINDFINELIPPFQ